MANKKITKKLSNAELGLTRMKQKYLTISLMDNPENMFGRPPKEIIFLDRQTGERVLLAYKKEGREFRFTKIGTYYKTKNASFGDSLVMERDDSGGKPIFYIDLRRATTEENPQEELNAKVIYAYLKESLSHREIEVKILGKEAKANGGGYHAMEILHNFGIEREKKGILNEISFDEEYKKSTDKYREALDLLKKYYPEFSSGSTINYFWMNANEKYWKIDGLQLNHEQTYTTHNDGKARQNPNAIKSVKKGDLIVGFQTKPSSKVLSLFEVTKAVQNSNDPKTKGEFTFKKIANSGSKPSWEQVMKLPQVKKLKTIYQTGKKGGNPTPMPKTGSVFNISKEEFDEISGLAKFEINTNKNIIKEFKLITDTSGLIFSEQLIQRFIASLCTKPFVICSGLSGSGKTKLAQAFAQWICYKEKRNEKNEQYCIIPVGADWTNREPLLGYPNALEDNKYVLPENGVLDLMIRAKKNYENYEKDNSKIPKPYFLILDEMNLSHVERYFADFLSTMESGEAIPFHTFKAEKNKIPQHLKLPKNLFIIGTVNIDETTYMFSPKVLDRANTIEFRLTEKDLEDFINSSINLEMDLLSGKGVDMGESFVKMALLQHNKNLKKSEIDLRNFFKELKKSGAEFGYRTANEIGRLMFMLETLGEEGNNLLDIAVMQKLLPKLHGSRSKMSKVLPVLAAFCLNEFEGKELKKENIEFVKNNYLEKFHKGGLTEAEILKDEKKEIRFKISFEKICRIYKNAMENGFASYAEA